ASPVVAWWGGEESEEYVRPIVWVQRNQIYDDRPYKESWRLYVGFDDGSEWRYQMLGWSSEVGGLDHGKPILVPYTVWRIWPRLHGLTTYNWKRQCYISRSGHFLCDGEWTWYKVEAEVSKRRCFVPRNTRFLMG
ncbi:MAG: hypothetical protein ACXABY_03370, partial [Candidatus Thorarchaeota archaeon]